MEAALDRGGIAIPAHPGRFGIGLYEYIENGADFGNVLAVEILNGSNRPGEQERAEELIRRYNYKGTGGSDAHVVSAIGTCMTRFENSIKTESDLVQELKGGDFCAVRIEETSEA